MEDEKGGGGPLKVLAEDHGLVAKNDPRGSARWIDAGPQTPEGQRPLAPSLDGFPDGRVQVEPVQIVQKRLPVVPAEDVHEVTVPEVFIGESTM